MTVEPVVYCANHPDREATLRCNRCDKPICLKCAVKVATGYRCRECVSQQQHIFETAFWYDYVSSFAVVFVLSAIAGAFVSVLGFFVLFVAPLVGSLLARVVLMVTRKRRSKYLPWAAAVAAGLGGIGICSLSLFGPLISILLDGSMGGLGNVALPMLIRGIWPLVYAGICATTVWYSLKGIRIN
jgi:B-box zinc finger